MWKRLAESIIKRHRKYVVTEEIKRVIRYIDMQLETQNKA